MWETSGFFALTMTEDELFEAIRTEFRKHRLAIPDDDRMRESLAAGGHLFQEVDELIKQYLQHLSEKPDK